MKYTLALLLIAGLPALADVPVTASLYTPLNGGGTVTSVDLSGISPLPSQINIPDNGSYSVSFSNLDASQGIVQYGTSQQGPCPNNCSDIHAIPVAGVDASNSNAAEYLTGDAGSALTDDANSSGAYFSTGANAGTIDITFDTAQTSLALLWGSIDTSNELTFFNGTTNLGSVTGADVQAAAAGFVSNGFQGPAGSAYAVVTPGTSFTSVVASSGVVSFEFTGVQASTTPFVNTPEPSAVLLMFLMAGVLALAFGLKRKLA